MIGCVGFLSFQSKEDRMGKKKAAPPPAEEKKPTTDGLLPGMPTEMMSTAEAIRTAIKELGGPDGDYKNQDVVNYVKEKYGKEVKTNVVSMYKTELRKEAGGGPVRARGRSSGSDMLTTIRQVRELADNVGGMAALKEIVAAFAD